MTAAQQFLTAAFPEFEVLTEPRPDGGLLLTLRNDDRTLVKRPVERPDSDADSAGMGRQLGSP